MGPVIISCGVIRLIYSQSFLLLDIENSILYLRRIIKAEKSARGNEAKEV